MLLILYYLIVLKKKQKTNEGKTKRKYIEKIE
jgi:hypothetical protein